MVLTIGAATAQLVALAAVPFLSRVYTPAQFGLLAVFTAIAGITSTLVTLRYETAIVLPKSEHEAQALVLLALLLVAAFGAALVVTSMLFLELRRLPEMLLGLHGWLVAAIFSGMAGAAVAIATAWLSRRRQYRVVASLRVGQAALAVVLGIALGLMAHGHGLLIAQLLSALAAAMFVALWMVPLLRGLVGVDLARAARLHVSAPRYLLASSVLDVVAQQLPVLLINSTFGASPAGQFSLAWRVLGLPAAVLGSAVGQVFFQRGSAEIHDGVVLVRQRFLRISLVLAILAVLPVALVALYGQELFVFVLGPQWAQGGQMAEWLVFSAAFYFVFSPTSSVLIILGHQRVLLVFGVVQFVYRAAAAFMFDDVMHYVATLVLLEVANVATFVGVVSYLLSQASRQRGGRHP